MNLPRSIHFTAMGGTGMEPLARWCLEGGVKVTGSDRDPVAVNRLRRDGFQCYQDHRARQVPHNADLLVCSTAVPKSNPEIAQARAIGIPVMERPDFLSKLFGGARTRVAITGTHGKTTVTSMISHMLSEAHRTPDAIIGGKVMGKGSYYKGDGTLFVAEADESNLGYQNLNPDVLVVNNLDFDHVDHYQNLHAIQEKILAFMASRQTKTTFVLPQDEGEGTGLLLRGSLRMGSLLRTQLRTLDTFGCGAMVDRAQLEGLIAEEGPRGMLLSVLYYGIPFGEFSLPFHGAYNARNALSAIAVGIRLGLTAEEIALGLAQFPGVHRRMEKLGATRVGTIYSDYAHHPTAIRKAIDALSMKYPNRCITVVFEPHRSSRMEVHWQGFGDALNHSAVDRAYILPLFLAGEAPREGIDSSLVVRACKKASLATPAEIAHIDEDPHRILLFLGAGPIDEIARATTREHSFA